MSNNYIDDLFDNLRRDPFKSDPTNNTSYELQKDFLSDPQGPAGWIADGVITDVELVDGSTLVGKVDTLPTLPDPNGDYPEGKVVYLTTNGKLYRNDSDVWTAAVAAVDLTGQITGTQITDDAITSPKIAANAIVADKIAANAITTDKLNANAVTAAKIAAGTITATEIAANTITAAKIVAGTITATEIANSTITGGKIVDATITGAKISNATITDANISSLNADKITAGTISAINVLASTITNDPAGVGLLIQGDGVGVDAGFGGVNDAVIYAGYNATTVDNAIANAPNSIYLSPTSVTLPDYTTGSGVQVIGDVGASIVGGTQALIGTSNVPLTGNTAYFGPSVFGTWDPGITLYSESDSITMIAAENISGSATNFDFITDSTGFHANDTIMLESPLTTATGVMSVEGSLTVGSTVYASVPTGSVTAYLGAYNNLPAGWLLCNGASVSRTTYDALFAIIGTSYGSASGSTFNLPNLFGHMLVGGTSTTVPASGQQTGSADSYLNATWDHNHIHSHVTDPAATTSGANNTSFGAATGINAVAANGHTHSTNIAATTSDTDSTAMSTSPTQKRTRVNYIIKY